MRFASGYMTLALLAAAAPAHAGGPVNPVSEVEIIAPAAIAPPTPFAGGYVGAGLGYAFSGDDRVGIRPGDTVAGDLELSGAIADIHAGYRWQPGVFVWGVELGVEGGNVEDSDGGSSTEMKYGVTLRGMSGWTPNDTTLIYGFAGVAHGKFDYTVGGDMNFNGETSETGYVVGFGVERLLNDRWSIRGEYQYADFGKKELEANGFVTEVTPKFQSVRVGVNYRF